MGRGSSSSGGGGGGGSRGSSFSGSFRGSSRSSYSSSSRSSYGGSYSHSSYNYNSSGSEHHSSSSFLAVGIFLLFFTLSFLAATINTFSSYNSYSPVIGTAIKDTYSNGWHYTTYTYTVEGVNYENRSQEGWEYPEVNGAKVVIYYLKEDPNTITENSPSSLASCITVTALTGLFFTISILLLVKYKKVAKQEKLAKQTNSTNLNHTNSTTILEADITCKYCDSKYSKTLNNCPHCGASKK